MINENAAKTTSNPSYWKLLRKLNKAFNYRMHIRDLDYRVVIKQNVTNYWAIPSKHNKLAVTNLVENLHHLENDLPGQGSLDFYTMDMKSI